jgi:hypothetical protein
LLPYPTVHPFVARDGSGKVCGGYLHRAGDGECAVALTEALTAFLAE